MKFGANLGILEPYTCGPDNMSRSALWYWEDFYKSLSATRFDGFEMTYKPWDFNLGRSGMPYTAASMKTFYGSLKGFRDHLKEIGIPELPCLHISAGDVVNDLGTRGLDESKWIEALVEFSKEAVESASELGAEGIVLTPTPEMGYLFATGLFDNGKAGPEKMMGELTEATNKIGEMCKKNGLTLGIRDEFWTMVHGDMIDMFMENLDKSIVFSPDAAGLYITKTDACEKIRKYKDRLGFVMLNDTFFEDKNEVFKQVNPEYPQVGAQRVYCMVGYGKVDKVGIYNALKEVGYDGWVICGSREATNVPKAVLNLRWYIDYVLLKA